MPLREQIEALADQGGRLLHFWLAVRRCSAGVIRRSERTVLGSSANSGLALTVQPSGQSGVP